MKPDSPSETVVLSGVIVVGVIGVALVVYWVLADLFNAVLHSLSRLPH